MVFQFGAVVEVIRPVDKLRDDAPKNFCFITFDKEEPARQLVFKGTTSLKGHQLVVSRVSSNNSKMKILFFGKDITISAYLAGPTKYGHLRYPRKDRSIPS